MARPIDEMLDPAFVDLLADPRIALRRPPPELPVAVLRAAANRFMASASRPAIHATTDIVIDRAEGPLAMRLYRPSPEPGLPVILFCHGGGFLFGDLETHDAMCRTMAVAAGAAVLAVAYRLAPEHPFPAALDDCGAALAWIGDKTVPDLDASRIAIAGDSAGGQLALATALGANHVISHVGLLYPLLDPRRASESARLFDEGHMLTGSFVEWAWEAYGSGLARGDQRYDLALADLDRLPPVTIVTAALDPLRDEGEAFGARLEAAGVAVELRRYPGMIHGFAGMPQLTPAADAAIAYLGRRIAASF